MTEITEGNKLIAEFMGGKKDVFNITHKEYYKGLPHGRTLLIENLQYHTSWDWLMPAWKKLRTDVWYSSGESYPKEFMLYVENFKTACFNDNIGDARNAVLDGIKWYNQNK